MASERRDRELGVKTPDVRKYLIFGLIGAAVLVGLYVLSRYNYLLFHSLVEIYSIVIAFAIFAIAWNSRKLVDNYFLLLIGMAFLFIGALDLVHTLAYKGIGIIPGMGTNPATQLWVATRYIQAISLFLAASVFIKRKFNPAISFLAYSLVTALLLTSIFYWQIFPAAFIDGAGLTHFKIVSEYVISFILLCSIGQMIRNRKRFDRSVFNLMVASMAVTIASEMAFTLYSDAYGISNMFGHLLKVISFYLIYKALIETGITRPYLLLFHNLKQRETGLARQAAELTQINSRLKQEVNERQKAEEALQRRTEELENINRELESLGYSISHDLRAPLRAVEGFSQALVEDYGDKLSQEGQDYIRRIRESSQLMAHLIDDLLKLSRVARAEIHPETVNLTELAQEVAYGLRKANPGREVEFAADPQATGYGDPRLLRLVMENLLSNAWKFSSKVPQPRVEFGVRGNDGQKIYFVRDNGAGFNMAYAGKLFSPFQRLHSEAEFPGTGIGLASVQRIISRHGGRVWAEGEKDKGATFYFTLS